MGYLKELDAGMWHLRVDGTYASVTRRDGSWGVMYGCAMAVYGLLRHLCECGLKDEAEVYATLLYVATADPDVSHLERVVGVASDVLEGKGDAYGAGGDESARKWMDFDAALERAAEDAASLA